MSERYINLFTDFGFKKIFGEEVNKDLMIDFLNELLRGREEIKDLTYLKNEHAGQSEIDRKAVFDLYCENEKGEKFIVEVQRVKQKFFKDRSLYYSTFAIQEQALRGKEWQYELKGVYTIGIMDFTFDERKEYADKVSHHVQLMETETLEVFYDKLTFIFLEIPKFSKSVDELASHHDKWMFLLKNLHRLDRVPERLQERIFLRLFELAEIAKFDKKERVAYEDSLKDYRDLKSSMDTYFEEGFEDGYHQKAIETAKAMKKDGQSIEVIAKYTSLSVAEIEAL
jgi:predicted transposase/invertase (TIGR01784 family)